MPQTTNVIHVSIRDARASIGVRRMLAAISTLESSAQAYQNITNVTVELRRLGSVSALSFSLLSGANAGLRGVVTRQLVVQEVMIGRKSQE